MYVGMLADDINAWLKGKCSHRTEFDKSDQCGMYTTDGMSGSLVDMASKDGNVTVHIAAIGFTKDEIDISFDESTRMLCISGSRKKLNGGVCTFESTFEVDTPSVEFETAKCSNGILEISYKVAPKTKKINIAFD